MTRRSSSGGRPSHLWCPRVWGGWWAAHSSGRGGRGQERVSATGERRVAPAACCSCVGCPEAAEAAVHLCACLRRAATQCTTRVGLPLQQQQQTAPTAAPRKHARQLPGAAGMSSATPQHPEKPAEASRATRLAVISPGVCCRAPGPKAASTKTAPRATAPGARTNAGPQRP